MLTLHQFPPAFGVPNASPFCLKLECYLRMAGLAYRTVETRDLAGAPKGTAPWIVEEDGTAVGDSALVIRRLNGRHGVDLDGWLDPPARAAALALRIMVEEHLVAGIGYNRWIDDANWPVMRDSVLRQMPAEAQDGFRDRLRQRSRERGLGVHEEAEIYALLVPEVTALSDWLGRKPFMMGERPAEVDCTAFGLVANLLMPTVFKGPLQDEAHRHPNLIAYNARMLGRYFPEWTASGSPT